MGGDGHGLRARRRDGRCSGRGAARRASAAWPGLDAGLRLWLLGAAVAAAIAVDAVPGLHAPGPRRQVNEEWLHRYRGWVYGAGFGLQLGLGVTTIVSTAAVYATAAAAVLAGSATAGAAVGAAFGAARAATLLAAGRVREPRALARLDRRLHAWERPARAAALAAEGGLVIAAAALALVGMRLAAHGIAVDLPAGWDGRVWSRPGGGPVLHAANVALPPSDGDFATRATAATAAERRGGRPRRLRRAPMPARRSTRRPRRPQVDPAELSPATLLHRRPRPARPAALLHDVRAGDVPLRRRRLGRARRRPGRRA